MTDFGDILKNWETQKKNGQTHVNHSQDRAGIPQDGSAWRNKKTEPVKKNDASRGFTDISDVSVIQQGKSGVSGAKQSSTDKTRSSQSGTAGGEPKISWTVWLHRYGVVDKDKKLEEEKISEAQSSRERVKQIPCEASIDLHGLTREEAWTRLCAFITECVRRGLSKVLIIHGKGNHSEDEPVLRQAVRSFIESDKRCGQFGFADKNLGGKGATWVIIRKKTDN